jgi:hypothetical protein
LEGGKWGMQSKGMDAYLHLILGAIVAIFQLNKPVEKDIL